MTWKKAKIIRKLLASLLSLVILIANPLTAKADWSQPEPPSTYLNPNELNANNPNPLTEALNKIGASPLNSDSANSLPTNKTSNYGKVDTVQGKLTLDSTDVKIPSNGFPLALHRVYNSNTQTGPFGIGWDYTYDRYLTMYSAYSMLEHVGDQGSRTYNYTKNDPSIHVTTFDESNRIQYPLDNGYYTAVQSSNTAQLTRNSDVTYTVQEKDGTTYTYNRYRKSWDPNPLDGKLRQITDPNGNSMTFQYDTQGHLTQITDTGGRITNLSYTGNLITSVTDPLGRITTYQYDGNNRLTQVTDPAGGVVTYGYDSNNRLDMVTGNNTYTYSYDNSGKVETIANLSTTFIETYA